MFVEMEVYLQVPENNLPLKQKHLSFQIEPSIKVFFDNFLQIVIWSSFLDNKIFVLLNFLVWSAQMLQVEGGGGQ